MALSAAVQPSGLADRIGMAQTTQVVQTKTLDYFFSLRNAPPGRLPADRRAGDRRRSTSTSACSGRTCRCCRSRSASIVQAAIDTGRSIELDVFIVRRSSTGPASLERDAPRRRPAARSGSRSTSRRPACSTRASRRRRSRRWSGRPGSIAAPDHGRVHRAAGRRRRRAAAAARSRRCAGSASASRSTTPAPATRASRSSPPSARRSSRSTARSPHGIARDDAKQALVEAFVSFGRRIGARLLAEGIEKPRRPGHADARSASTSARATCSASRPEPSPREPWRPSPAGRRRQRRRRPPGHRRSRPARRDADAQPRRTRPTTAGALAYHRGHDPARPTSALPDASARSSTRAALRDHRHDRPRRRAAPGRHLVPARRRRRSSSTARVGRRWPTNLLRDPRISVAVTDAETAIAGSA